MAARTQVAVTSVSRTAITAVPAPNTAPDTVNGNFVLNDGATVLVLLNGDGAASHTLTVQLASGVDGQSVTPRTYTVPISGIRQWVGPFPLQFYGSTLNFNLDSTQVSVQAVSLLGP